MRTAAEMMILPPAARRIAEFIQPSADAEPTLIGVYLFGSRATGEHHPGSNVDLGVLFSE